MPAVDSRLTRALRGGLAAFVGGTLAWIAVCLFASGDAVGLTWLPLAGVALAAAVGLALALRVRSRAFHVVVVGLTLLCALFWVAAPNGWWATRPPEMPGRMQAPP